MQVRNFTWADFPALVEFINLGRHTAEGEPKISSTALKEELSRPGLTPEENCFLFSEGEALRAYSVLHPEPRIGRTVLQLGIHPDHAESNVAKEIVRHGLARANKLRAQVLDLCSSPSAFWKDLLEAEGFTFVRNYCRMKWQQQEVPSVDMPEGFVIESFRPGDEERLTQVQNASFDGSWGFCPNTVEEVSYKAHTSAHSSEGVRFLARDGDTAGYCWPCIIGDTRNSVGMIGMIGIHPAYRSKGLSRPILLAGMQYLNSKAVNYIGLEVDGSNAPGVKLYTSVGFEKVTELHWFEARLSGL